MHILPNLRRAMWARCFWKNQYGQVRHQEDVPVLSHNNEPFNPDEVVQLGDISITRLEHAKRLGGPDKWTFHITIRYPASESVDLSGEHAMKVWKAWKAVVYGQKD